MSRGGRHFRKEKRGPRAWATSKTSELAGLSEIRHDARERESGGVQVIPEFQSKYSQRNEPITLVELRPYGTDWNA